MSAGTATITATSGTKSGSATLTVPAATLVSIAVTPATATVQIGLTKPFVATGTYSDGTTLDISNTVTWTSGNTPVATVLSTTGVATGVSAGTATITATSGSKSGSATLTVPAATLVSIAVTPATATVQIGLTQPFVATGTYSDGTTVNISNTVTWTSGSPLIGTVLSGTGVATGVSAGTATITATSGSKSGSATLTVPAATLVSIAVTPATATVQIGLTQPFVAMGTYSDGTTANISSTVAWTSGSPLVGTVFSTTGVATGVSAGTATITATLGAKSGSAILTVPAATLSSIAVTPATATVQIGLTQPFVAMGTYSDGTTANISSTVAWTSGSPLVGTVFSTTGVATGVSAGTATITATLGAKSGSAILTVPAATLSSIAVTPATAIVSIGLTQPFVAMGTYSNGTTVNITNTVAWTSGSPLVGTVLSTTGVATGVSAGTATITATSGAKSGSATMTVPAAAPLGPPPVLLGLAGNFAGLTKAGITDVPSSAITGSIGASPITGAAIGVTCAEVTGTIYAVNAAGPAPCAVIDPVMLTTAVSNLETAYTDAAGRPAGVGPNLNLGAGTVAGQTLVPGTYTWGSAVTITTDLTLNGGPNDVWLFQITGTLDLSANKNIILTGGALPKNVFWQVAGAVTLFPGSHFEGTILAKTNIAMQTGASINGRLLAQTGVSLQQNAVTIPAP